MKSKSKVLDEHGYPIPKQVECFKCKGKFWLKFVVPQQNYSRKNNWGYWTDKTEDENTWICNSCLRNFYLNEKQVCLMTIKDIKKRNKISAYISGKFI